MPKVITSNATSSGGGAEYVQVNADWTATEGVSAILNKPEIPSPMTATEILTAIKTVDGIGSGLDADLLDGKQATEFSLVGHVPIEVTDTASIDLSLVGQSLSASAKFGTTSGTVAQGNDVRFTDARNPLTHNHDDMYFTETEINGFLAGKANISHSHLIADLPPYPTTLPANGGTADTLTGLTPTIAELNFVDGVTSAIQGQIDLKAPLDSPSFTGTPVAPTPVAGNNSTQIATTAYVQTAMSSAGSGDMLKSVYDTNGNNKVDNADYSTTSGNADTVDGYHGANIVKNIATALNGIDFNTITESGVYQVVGGTNINDNNVDWGVLLVLNANGYVEQKLYDSVNLSDSRRRFNGSAWSAWSNLINTNGIIDGGSF